MLTETCHQLELFICAAHVLRTKMYLKHGAQNVVSASVFWTVCRCGSQQQAEWETFFFDAGSLVAKVLY